jgi:hypothetical protein
MGYSSSPVIGGSSALFTAPSSRSWAACQPQRDTRRVSLRSWRHARSEIQTVRWAYALGAITATQSNAPFPFRISLSIAVAVAVRSLQATSPIPSVWPLLCTANDILSSPCSLPSSLQILALPYPLETDAGAALVRASHICIPYRTDCDDLSRRATAWLKCYYPTCRQDLSRFHRPEAYDARRRPCRSHPHLPHHRSSNELVTPATEERSSALATDPDHARTATLLA